MKTKSTNTLERTNKSYNKILQEFLDELIKAGKDIDEIAATTANLCVNTLELSKTTHSLAVLLTDFSHFNGTLDTHYFESNIVSEDTFDLVLKPLIVYLNEHQLHPAEYLTYEQVSNKPSKDENIPDSILVMPLYTSSVVYGYIVVFYHDSNKKKEIASQEFKLLAKCLHIASLALECEFNKAIYQHHLINDYLTGLPNRDYVYEAIVYMLQTAEAFGNRFAIIIVRVNGLKGINNSLGMITGDLLLKVIGSIIKSAVKKCTDSDSLTGRLGGGDFAILLSLPSEGYDEDSDNLLIQKCCKTIISETDAYIELNGYKIYSSVNIGASIYPTHGETADDLLRKAELAKNDAKQEGPDTFSTFKSFMDGDAEEVLFLNSNLPTAVETNQFEMFYQALVDVKTGRADTAEALIRWKHPQRGMVRPDLFIPFAESTSYGIQIDLLVLDMACKQINAWRDKGFDITISINISPKHFVNGLIYESVKKALDKHNINPSRLRLELLENILLNDFTAAVKVIDNLRSLGVSIALDDFGSGYSSLEYVSKLPMDYLKIDRTFMMNIKTNPDNKIILETIMTLAKGMKVKTVAEGVECKEGFQFLRDIGCDVAQGYFINKPMPASEFEEFLAGWQHI